MQSRLQCQGGCCCQRTCRQQQSTIQDPNRLLLNERAKTMPSIELVQSSNKQQQRFVHRHVVTSFICKLENNSFKNFKVAIFKRSNLVRTHQGLWAACSGTIDTYDSTATDAAWRELEEETSLTKDDLYLLNAGKSHDVFSKDLARRWTIHPFAFVLKPGAKDIVLDFEHTEYRFVDPEAVETYVTVPDLDITLWRTLVGPDTAQGVRALSEDKTSGARTLATKALRVLLLAITGSDLEWSSNVTSYWRAFRLVAWHLANGRPSMGAAMERAVLRAVALATPRMNSAKTVTEAREICLSACTEALDERVSGRGRVASEFVKYMVQRNAPASDKTADDEVTFLTLSYSCAKLCLLEYIRGIPDKRVHIIILESRPGFEGVHMALDLVRQTKDMGSEAASRVRFTLAADAAVGAVAQEVDIVLLGSDRINPDGDVSNKIGSLSTVVTARAVSNKKLSVVVAAEVEKISRRRDVDLNENEKHLSTDLTNAWKVNQNSADGFWSSPYVEIATPLFEWVPSKYVDAYITENGLMERNEVTAHSDIASKEWNDVFRDL